MTARGLLLAVAVLASEPTEAASCHRYSVWRYPWAQSCGLYPTVAKQEARRASRVQILANSRKADPPLADGPAMPLPSLARTDLDGGEADEPTRGRLLLRAAMEAANGH
jgi:hypothetical protein